MEYSARNEDQLRQTSEQLARLEAASNVTPPYPFFPYYRQAGFAWLNPSVIPYQQFRAVA